MLRISLLRHGFHLPNRFSISTCRTKSAVRLRRARRVIGQLRPAGLRVKIIFHFATLHAAVAARRCDERRWQRAIRRFDASGRLLRLISAAG